jgi:hypothetical protein
MDQRIGDIPIINYLKTNDRLGNPSGHCRYPTKTLDFEDYISAAGRYSEAIKLHGWDVKLPSNVELRRHVAYSKRKLELWDIHRKGSKIISKEEIMCSSLDMGPEFSNLLKKMNDYCLINMLNINKIKTMIPEEYLVEGYDHVDCLPDPKVLIHWTEESDDIRWMFVPLRNEFPTYEFKEMFRSYLNSLNISYSDFDKELIQKVNVGFRTSAKVHLGNKNTVYHGEIPDTYFKVLPGYSGKYCLIQGSPGTTRAVVIPDPSTKVKVDVMEHLFSIITEKDKSSLLGCNGEEKTRRIKGILSSELFFHLDLKKEGLTIPRQLIKAAMEVIQEVSDIDLSEYLDFDDLTVEIEGKMYSTERGRTLGWSNNACTAVISCILHDITHRILDQEDCDVANKKFDGIKRTSLLKYTVSTDDIVVGSTFKSNAKNTSKYASMLNLTLNARLSYFDLILSSKKVFVSKYAKILGEVYIRDAEHISEPEENIWGDALKINHHRSTITMLPMWNLVARAYHAWSHFEAKTLFSAAYTTIAGSYDQQDYTDEVRKIYDYWGPEFKTSSPISEVVLPYSCGGWIVPRSENLDASLDEERFLPYFVEFKELGGIDKMFPFSMVKSKEGIDPETSKYEEDRERSWYFRKKDSEGPESLEDDLAESSIISAVASFDLDDQKIDIVDRMEPRLSAISTSLSSGSSEFDVFLFDPG